MIAHRKNAGFSMVEVLITIVILTFGLLGLAGLQAKALSAQMEAYQRSQALVLLKDMANRINANRKNAAAYVTTLGTGAACPDIGTSIASTDLNGWCNELLGAAETQGGANVGAMIGARGCITQIAAPSSGTPAQYVVTVAWQGLSTTIAPSDNCGSGQYGSNDAMRRVISLPVNIADLN